MDSGLPIVRTIVFINKSFSGVDALPQVIVCKSLEGFERQLAEMKGQNHIEILSTNHSRVID